MVFVPTVLPGGYVTDMLLTITFDGETWEEAHLGRWYIMPRVCLLFCKCTVAAFDVLYCEGGYYSGSNPG